MPYKYLPDIATADIAFEVKARSLNELFADAALATMNVMVEDLDQITEVQQHTICLEDSSLEVLLFNFLQEIIFLKDAEEMLGKPSKIEIIEVNDKYKLDAVFSGEKINVDKHQLNVDIKAITYHMFKIERIKNGWRAQVVVDI